MGLHFPISQFHHVQDAFPQEHVCRGPGVNNMGPSANGHGFEPRMAHFFFSFF